MNSDYGNNISSTASQNYHQAHHYYSHAHQQPHLLQSPAQQDSLVQAFCSPAEQNVTHFVTPIQPHISDPTQGLVPTHSSPQPHNLYIPPSGSHQQHHTPVTYTYIMDNAPLPPQRSYTSMVPQQSPQLVATVTPPSHSLSSSLNLFAGSDTFFNPENRSSCAVLNSQTRPSSAPACTQFNVSPLQVQFQPVDIHQLPQSATILNPNQTPVVVDPPRYACRKETIDYQPSTHTSNPSGDESYQPVVLPLPVLSVQPSVGNPEYPQDIQQLLQPTSSNYRLTHMHWLPSRSRSEPSHYSTSTVEANPVQQTAHVILPNPHLQQPVIQQFCPVHSVPVDTHLVQHQLVGYPQHVEMMVNPQMQQLQTPQLHHLPTTEGTQSIEDSYSLDAMSDEDDRMRLIEFGKKFKQHRLQFGYTPADVAQLINVRSGCSDFPVCEGRVLMFESGSLPLLEMQKLVMLMEVFLNDVGWVNEEQFKELTKTFYNPRKGRKKRVRTLIESHQRQKLEEEFSANSRPTVSQLNEIAGRVEMDKSAVRIWFCNKRQKLRQKAKEEGFYEGEEEFSSSQNVISPDSEDSGGCGSNFPNQ